MIHAMPNLLWIDVLFSFDPHLQLHIDNWTSSISSVLLISQPRSVCEIPFFYIFSWPFKAPKRVFFFLFSVLGCLFLGRRFLNKTWWPEWPTRIRGKRWKWIDTFTRWYVGLHFVLKVTYIDFVALGPLPRFFLGVYGVTSEWPTLLETSS